MGQYGNSGFENGARAACLDLLQLLSVNTNKIGRGEFIYFFHFGQDMNVGTSWNILRPETVESLFYL
ncbi:hypothetical protein CMV_026408 [Castanea mollissima]|uniref:Uncharacterized protein n=1 Tax=Castanea mollissima TaxID=60419 RepID=A0A8J4V3V8_9ROSI|nr:hypothetical protein CMV_026408 [Castanea mollissima]